MREPTTKKTFLKKILLSGVGGTVVPVHFLEGTRGGVATMGPTREEGSGRGCHFSHPYPLPTYHRFRFVFTSPPQPPTTSNWGGVGGEVQVCFLVVTSLLHSAFLSFIFFHFSLNRE
eukprot:Hpha_TRINITY_DN14790_c0_g1::TRINITY_DN14790_c0_g1_i2::g.102739::m.102739